MQDRPTRRAAWAMTMVLERVLVMVLVMAGGTTGAARADQSWLPAEAQEAAAQHLAARVGQVDFGNAVDPQSILEDARIAVAAVLDRLEEWGPAGVVEKAPVFPDLEVPPHADPRLFAMARYGMCSFHLGSIWQNERQDANGPQRRVSAAFADVALALAAGYLRHQYQALGGRDEVLLAYLGSEEMEALSAGIRDQAEAMKHTSGQCAPVLTALLERESP